MEHGYNGNDHITCTTTSFLHDNSKTVGHRVAKFVIHNYVEASWPGVQKIKGPMAQRSCLFVPVA